MKKLSTIFVIVLFIFTLNIHVYGEEKSDEIDRLTKDSKSAIVLEQDTGELLVKKNIDEKLPPASMTKIMTLLLVMKELNRGELKLEDKITVSENASSMGGSQVFLETGEEITVENLLKSIAVASANDASVALAEHISGSEEAFVKSMNKEVTELGLKHTKFQNSSGLPAEDHYSTAYDMAIIAKELLKYESITDYTSIYDDYLRKGEENEFWLVNTNKLIKFYPGVDGLKTGYTDEAKYCLTATAKKDGMRVISVVMGAKSPKQRNKMITDMLDYSFGHYNTEKLYDRGDVITEIDMLKASPAKVNVVTSQSVSLLLKKGKSFDNVKTSYKINEDLDLPLKKGTEVGKLVVKNNQDVLVNVPLVVEDKIEKASFYNLFKRSMKKIANND